MFNFTTPATPLADSALLEAYFGAEATDVLESCNGSWQAVLTGTRNPPTPAWAALASALEILQRALGEVLHSADAMRSPEIVRKYLRTFLLGRPAEVFVVMYLDAQHHLIRTEEAFLGTLTQTSVYPREIARRAIELGSSAILCAHNHPSGISEPSRSDEHLTRQLRDALALIDVQLLDHFIIALEGDVSFAERGLL